MVNFLLGFGGCLAQSFNVSVLLKYLCNTNYCAYFKGCVKTANKAIQSGQKTVGFFVPHSLANNFMPLIGRYVSRDG